MYKTINGFTKERMKEMIMQRNKGRVSRSHTNDPFLNSPCAYRGTGDNACGVGVFIPDDLYDHRMENCWRVDRLLAGFPELNSHMPICEVGLTEMQGIHDQCLGDIDPRKALCKFIDDRVENA